jgi:glycosyltransferase involved in cell wall biosynthesis
VLLRAFRKALENVPASLDIFGDGVMRQSLEALTDELGLRAAVTFHGWQPQAAIAARLREADVFVLPSVWECGGAVVLEAMAAGLPVIATNWGGPCDYLDDSCGILVNPTAPDEFVVDLADAMRSLAVDPDRRRAMGSAALARVRRDFDWEKKIDRMLAFYAETLAATKTKPAAKLQRSISGSGTI